MQDALGYYKILEIDKTATEEEIKNSYRNKVKEWHPDFNHSPQAPEMFRLLSEAYDILSNQTNKKYYDILSLCCNEYNYPKVEKLEISKDGEEDVNLRIVKQNINKARLTSYSSQKQTFISSYPNAIKRNFQNSISNWLQGWWHYKTFFRNISSIVYNFSHPIDKEESCRMLVINMLAHIQNQQINKAVQSGLQACDYLDKQSQKTIKDFLICHTSQMIRPHKWKLNHLRAVQLLVPAIIVIAIVFSGADFSKINSFFAKRKEINYYQNVRFESNTQATNDVIVGNIMNIPVNKNDNSKLYHLKKNENIMYGPSDKFDILKKGKANQTVRLTGFTPDNVWARIMIDNGEMGFVHYQNIKQGKGDEIPYGSSIIK